MDFSWSIPWSFHGILEYGHAFVISTHGFSMYFSWSTHGISSGVLSMAIEKTWVFHENPMDFHGQYNKFSKYGHAVPRKTYGSDHGFPWNTGNHGFTMSCHVIFFGFPWFSHGPSMNLFLWFLVLGLLQYKGSDYFLFNPLATSSGSSNN